ncbi:alpha/beta hydrolase family protein [Gemmatimonas sp.]|uniref:alpha/beta hydrolase family protein n=1 Tax=Gemmatimonas sp. TaxID=1962908 RepID=UPI003F6F0D68
MHSVQPLSAGLRRLPRFASAGVGALFGLLSACVQPLTVARSDAATVLANRTITAPNPGLPGTHKVARLYYGSGTDARRPEYRDSIMYRTGTVDASAFARTEPANAKSRKKYWGYDNTAFPLNARVWYPEGEGTFPLVLVVHGNHRMTEFSDPGYQWLGELLASRGFILASIDENFLNGNIRGENDARGWMLLKHLEVFRALNDSAGKPLFGKIDMKRIALMGHSRGGEAVAIAGAFNRLSHYPDDATVRFNFNFDIKALVAIAPVDGQYKPAEQPTPVSDYNYLVIHGSHDGDVSSFMGLTQYNRFRFTRPGTEFKSAIWMHRANHGQWNTVWNNKDNGSYSVRALQLKALVDGEEQRRFGRVVIGGFLEAALNGRAEYRELFRDHRAAGDWLPPEMYLTRYADANTRWLATFEEDVDVSTGTAPGVRIQADSVSTWKESDSPSRARASTFRSNMATIGWNNAPAGKDTTVARWPARIAVTVPDSLRQAWQLSSSSALLLTIGSTDQKPGPRKVSRDTTKRDSTTKAAAVKAPQKKEAPKPKRPPKDTVAPDLTVELEDASGRTARMPLSTFGAVRMPIESYIYRRKGRDKTQFPTLAEPVMQTYVMPLARFTSAAGGFDVGSLRTIRLVFDRKRSGAITLDDIGITR